MRKTLYFVDLDRNPRVGSSQIRSYQLMRLTRDIAKRYLIEASISSNISMQDSIYILNKNSLKSCKVEEILISKRRGNFMVADPLDGKLNLEVLSACDMIIASSKLQEKFLKQQFQAKRVAYLGHHVDLRIGTICQKNNHFSMAYFGELENTLFNENLKNDVTFVATNTRDALNLSWIEQLQAFNAHYVIRRPQDEDGFKPFTKGFIAAYCGAPALVDIFNQEAKEFLPYDYPFYTDATSILNVQESIKMMNFSYGTSIWEYAQTTMSALARSTSRTTVVDQFEAILQGSRD